MRVTKQPSNPKEVLCEMKCTILPLDIQLPNEPFAFDLQSLVERLSTIPDLRAPRGVRYPLPVVLTVAVLAKLAGHGIL